MSRRGKAQAKKPTAQKPKSTNVRPSKQAKMAHRIKAQ
jgi:hypothetical protein